MRVAVVGTGFISTLVTPKIVRWGYTVTDVVSTPRSLTKAQELAGPLGARASCDYDAVLAREDVDAVYLGIPNDLHHDYATRALRAGKHVILEKPMAANSAQAQEILDLARERGLLLFDATTTFYLPTTRRVAEWLPLVGALMDLGHYCVSWLCRMFGEPRGVTYAANVERGIDTSGVALLDYGDFKAMSIAAKDCDAPSYQIVQGSAGYIRVDGKPNGLGTVELCLHDGSVQTYVPPEQDQYQGEFEALRTFAEGGDEGLEECWRMAELGLVVSRVQTQARASAGIVFAADAR